MRDAFNAGRMNPAPLMSPLSVAVTHTHHPDEPASHACVVSQRRRCAWNARHPTRQTPE